VPFTLSHPAAAVPLARNGLVLSALVVGSMAPDFPYFIHLSTASQYGHTLPGVFLFCVPAGLVVLWVFHKVLKLPLLTLLPLSYQERLISVLGNFRFSPSRRFLLIILSLVVGAFTHIAWDSFTHPHAWGVHQFPVLNTPIIYTPQGSIRVFKLLQYGSTVTGAALLIYWYLKWFRGTSSHPVNLPMQLSSQFKRRFIILAALSALILAGVNGFRNISSMFSLHNFALHATLAGFSAVIVELIVFSVFWHLVQSKNKPT
jgi:hypothetical protein